MVKFTELLEPTKTNPKGASFDWERWAPGAGVLTVKDKRAYVRYGVVEFPVPQDGRAFQLSKADDEPGTDPEAKSYTVFVGRSRQDKSCECRGFLRWNHCKHLAAVEAIIANDWMGPLPAVDPVPADEPDFVTAFGG